MVKERRYIKHYSYRKRFLGVCAAERLQILNQQQKIFIVFMLPWISSDVCPTEFALHWLLNLCEEYQAMVYEPEYVLPRPLRLKHRTIESFMACDIPHSFRFRSTDQLQLLKRLLQIPEVVSLDNNVALNGEEVFLFGLRRMAYPSRYFDLLSEFGGEITVWSRAFHWFINYIYDNFHTLIESSMERFVSKFPQYSVAIRNKVVEKGCDHLAEIVGFRVAGFIDNTIFSTCRPGGGPVCDGVGAPRHDNSIQEAFYTGWKHIHGVKIQTVTLPDGIIADVFGPVSLRHNDLFTLAESDMNDRLDEMQEGVYNNKYCLYGDSAYPVMSSITSRHSHPPLSVIEVLENKCMSSVRESIEWVNDDIKSKFAFVGFHKGLKLRQSKIDKIVCKMIVVAALLTNCYKCMNGCQTSAYFQLPPPTIEEYFGV